MAVKIDILSDEVPHREAGIQFAEDQNSLYHFWFDTTAKLGVET